MADKILFSISTHPPFFRGSCLSRRPTTTGLLRHYTTTTFRYSRRKSGTQVLGLIYEDVRSSRYSEVSALLRIDLFLLLTHACGTSISKLGRTKTPSSTGPQEGHSPWTRRTRCNKRERAPLSCLCWPNLSPFVFEELYFRTVIRLPSGARLHVGVTTCNRDAPRGQCCRR